MAIAWAEPPQSLQPIRRGNRPTPQHRLAAEGQVAYNVLLTVNRMTPA
jgi:hypothetical protein